VLSAGPAFPFYATCGGLFVTVISMQTKTAPQSNEKYVRRSMQDYLEGEQTLNWLIGAMRSGQADPATIRQLFAELPINYGKPERRKELSDWLDSQLK
jgi:hypothetical protein